MAKGQSGIFLLCKSLILALTDMDLFSGIVSRPRKVAEEWKVDIVVVMAKSRGVTIGSSRFPFATGVISIFFNLGGCLEGRRNFAFVPRDVSRLRPPPFIYLETGATGTTAKEGIDIKKEDGRTRER